MTPDARIASIAERQHSVFTRSQALNCGVTPDQIDGRIARGIWKPLHRSVYRTRGAPLTFEGSALAAALAAGPRAVVSHTTAARLFRVEGISSDSVHITIPREARARLRRVVVHQVTGIARSDVTKIGVIPVTKPERTLFDVAGMLSRVALEDVLDDLARREVVSVAQILRRLSATNRRGHKGWGTLRELCLVRVGKPVSGSGRENRLRRLMKSAGLRDPVAQYEIRRSDGKLVARVDFAYPELKLAIEFDGYAHHSTRKQWERDRKRQNAIVDLGWLPLRITDEQLRTDPEAVVAPMLRRLAASETVKRRKNRQRR